MIYVVGMGPGNPKLITKEAEAVIREADLLIGAKRHLEEVKDFSGEKRMLETDLEALVQCLEDRCQEKVVVLASGDPLIYGIGKFLASRIQSNKLCIISGISSIQYMFSKIPLDMNDIYVTSSHGKTPDFDRVLSFPKVAMVTDDKVGPKAIADEIIKRGLKKRLFVGENLAYPDEKVTVFKPHEITEALEFNRNVVVILDEE